MEDDTRAEIARRRLAALAADFDRRHRAVSGDGARPADSTKDVSSAGDGNGAQRSDGTIALGQNAPNTASHDAVIGQPALLAEQHPPVEQGSAAPWHVISSDEDRSQDTSDQPGESAGVGSYSTGQKRHRGAREGLFGGVRANGIANSVQWRLSPLHIRIVVAIVAALVVGLGWWLMAARPHESDEARSADVSTESSDAENPSEPSSGQSSEDAATS